MILCPDIFTPMKIAIIGGGAAGFMAAITAKETRPDADVYIMEQAHKVLAKVAVTGGGRCNVTNSFRQISDLRQAYPRGHRLMKRLFSQFDYRETYRWFESHGVPLTTQTDDCVFPVSQDAQSIVGCLVNEAQRRLGAKVLTGYRVERIVRTNEGFVLHVAGHDPMSFDRVAVTTGGMPHRENFLALDDLGHTTERPIPALFTFSIADAALTSLMGTVVNEAVVSIPKTKLRAEGPLLITHWGMSGPAILKLSSHAARYLHEHEYVVPLSVAWAGHTNTMQVAEMLTEMSMQNSRKQVVSTRPFGLPTRLWQYLLGKVGLPEERRWAETGQRTVNRLAEILTNDSYLIEGKGSYREEFVTCGGVRLNEVDGNTLESRQVPHLYFAGEVLDIDAITGGFNLQAAWTTGTVVGRHIVE